MSLTDRFVEEYVGNPKFIDLLRAILDLNQYEALSFCSLALIGDSTAPRIADASGIPRSKIYLSLESLIKKELIVKMHDSKYKVRPDQIERLSHRVKDLSSSFEKFVEKLAIYSRPPSRTVEAIKSTLNKVILENGYHIVSGVALDSLGADEYGHASAPMRAYVYELTDRMYAERHGSLEERKKVSRLRRKLIDAVDEPRILINLVDEIIESSTSGMRVALTVLTEDKTAILGGKEAAFIGAVAASLAFHCQADILVFFPETQLQQKLIKMIPRWGWTKIYLISAHEPNFENAVVSMLNEFDRTWLDSRRMIEKISNEIMELKMSLTSTLDSIYTLSRSISHKHGKYQARYLEILERIQADLIASEDSLSTTKQEIEEISERLELYRRIPDPSTIDDISKRVGALREDLQRKVQTRDQLLEDILAYIRGGKTYIDYGYSTNPFVFTVPPEYPRSIVDQENAKKRFEKYLQNMIKGSSRNFAFIYAEEGMGKTHFLSFYVKNINSKKFGNSIALKLSCKPRSDIIDLYPQISLSISRLIESGTLKSEIRKVLEASGTPKNIADFLLLLRSLNTSIIESGFQSIFLMIDDFENTLPSESTNITPRSILQLTELTKLENMGIVLAMRDKSWKEWNKEIYKRIPTVGKYNLIKLRKFGPVDTCKLLNYRMEETDQEIKKKPPTFNETVSERICKEAQGIPRRIISIAREIFRVAILEKKNITISLVKGVLT